ncbi:HNH endonuclease signature motif containing protein [Streptomyces sp. 8L]|uniref:HNH endonuclease signature motif containing protein n=1 Tax=Streptomyces sp. 8L TaxID=2877242 RepID=UPI0027DF6214|nr:HNH endonuclease [Streptomyces sp. 8L]
MAPRRYTRELLIEVARTSTTWDEAVSRCGGVPTRDTRRHLRGRMAAEHIDTSHFPDSRVRHDEETLRRLVSESSSVAEVVRRLGISPVGGNHAHISRRIKALGLDTGHFAQTRRRRGTRTAETGLVLGSPADGRTPGERLRRWLLSTGVAEVCALCGVPAEWNGMPLRLQVDHVNGDWWDNRADNLRLLCPNCHATTDTFRGRRRGGEQSRGPVPRATLARAVAEARDMGHLLEALGLPDSEADRARLRRRIAAYGLDSSHFTGRGTHSGASPARLSTEVVLRREEPGGPRRKTALLRRALAEMGVPAVCALCGVGDTWRGEGLTLEIDHVNGDRHDNRAENLRFLCPSCHSQTPTFSRLPAPRPSDAVPAAEECRATTGKPPARAVPQPRQVERPEHGHEELAAAVAAAHGWADLMRRLGVRASTGRRRTLQRRVDELGLDTSHFKQRSAWHTYPDAAISDAVAESASLREAVRKLCVRMSVGALAHIERRIEALAIDTRHFTDDTGEARALPLTDAQLTEAAGTGRSVREVARLLDVADDTRSRKALGEMLERLGFFCESPHGKTSRCR